MQRSTFVVFMLLTASAAAAQSATAVLRADTPISARDRRAVTGSFALVQAGRSDTSWLRIFEQDGRLQVQMRDNTPSPLLHRGAGRFVPADAPEFVVRFTPVGGTATTAIVEGPGVSMTGARATRPVAADPSKSGPLFDEMVRADSLLFDAAYVTCDVAAINAMLTDDIEFYHDKSGFHAGDVVRGDFARLAANCPRAQGVTRMLRPGTLRVYPIKDYGVVQVGEHEFRERGRPGSAARFVNLWTKRSGHWQLSRVLSFDHLPVSVR